MAPRQEEIEIASIRHEAVVALHPEQVWDVLRDVGAVHRRLLPGRVREVTIEGDGRSLLVWTTDVLPDSLADVIHARTVRGAEEMKNVMERSHSGQGT